MPKPFADHLILKAIRESGGSAVAVTDEDAVKAIMEVGREEGFFFCPEGATTVVAMRELAKRSLIGPGDTVLLWNTAAAAKYPGMITA